MGHDPSFSLDNVKKLAEDGVNMIKEQLDEIAKNPTEKLKPPTPPCACFVMPCVNAKLKEAEAKIQETIKELDELVTKFMAAIPYELFKDVKALANKFSPDMLLAPLDALKQIPGVLTSGAGQIDKMVEVEDFTELLGDELDDIRDGLASFRDELKPVVAAVGINQLVDFFQDVIMLIKKHGGDVITSFITVLCDLLAFIDGIVDRVREFCKPPAIVACCVKPPAIIAELEKMADKIEEMVSPKNIRRIGDMVKKVFDAIPLEALSHLGDMFKETDQKLNETVESLDDIVGGIDKFKKIPGLGAVGGFFKKAKNAF